MTSADSDRIPNVPEYSASLAVEYGRQLGAALQGSVRTDFSYVDETASEFRPTSVFFERIDAYTLTNLRLRLSTFGFDLTLSAPPRTIGMGFSVQL